MQKIRKASQKSAFYNLFMAASQQKTLSSAESFAFYSLNNARRNPRISRRSSGSQL
ncbi:MAG: hypothetical protein R3Y59_10715 [bacterium]